MSLLLFDIDGTLIKTVPGFEDKREDMLDAVFKTHNRKVSFDSTIYDGSTDRLILIDMFQKNGVTYNETSLEACLKLYGDSLSERPREYMIIQGVLETLPQLSEDGHLSGLLTGNVETRARKKLGPVSSYFPFGGFGGTNFHNSRAELIPLAIQRAREKYGWTGNDQDTFVIDDTPKGLIAAIKAGVVPIGITTGMFNSNDLYDTGTKNIIENLVQLPGLLRRLSQ